MTARIRDAALSKKTSIKEMAGHKGEEDEPLRDCLTRTRHDETASICDAASSKETSIKEMAVTGARRASHDVTASRGRDTT